MLQILFDKISGMVSNILMLFDGLLEDTPVLMSIAIGLVLAMLSLSIFYFVQEQFFKITRLNTKGITLVDGVRDATRPLRIASNPNDINYIEMPRSYNEKDGTEFTYNIWFVINEANTGGEWSHLFHKGSPNGYPLRAPGAWIKGNTLKISMNTVEKIDNSVDIKNIPVKKWCMLTIILRGHILEIFLNGYLKETIDFGTKIPRLNDESVYFTHWGGFKGYIANANYFNYAVDGSEIRNLFQDGPATDGCSVGFDVPPYLATGENIQSECNK
jgi:hypothetical protein